MYEKSNNFQEIYKTQCLIFLFNAKLSLVIQSIQTIVSPILYLFDITL